MILLTDIGGGRHFVAARAIVEITKPELPEQGDMLVYLIDGRILQVDGDPHDIVLEVTSQLLRQTA